MNELERKWKVPLSSTGLAFDAVWQEVNDANVEDKEVQEVLFTFAKYGSAFVNDHNEWADAGNQIIDWCNAEGFSMPDKYSYWRDES